MTDFLPKTPVSLQIRKIIFDSYNNVDEPFTNDGIFEILKHDGDLDPAWIIDNIEPYIKEICDSGITRNIAQNFTTIWLKLFDLMEKHHCDSCGHDVFLGRSEEKICPNPSCNIKL